MLRVESSTYCEHFELVLSPGAKIFGRIYCNWFCTIMATICWLQHTRELHFVKQQIRAQDSDTVISNICPLKQLQF